MAAQSPLVLDVTKTRRDGRRLSLYSRLALQNAAGERMLTPAGDELMERKFSLRDAGSAAEIGALAAAVLAEIERLLSEP